MKRTDYFGKRFFAEWQGLLLLLLNAPIIRLWFRYVLRIHGKRSDVGKHPIYRITPNAVFWHDGNKYWFDVRTHDKFGKRIHHGFLWLWKLFHAWDEWIADRWIPSLSFGFDAFGPYYPDEDTETTSVDGTVGSGYAYASGVSWATIIADAGNGFADNLTTLDDALIYWGDTVTDMWVSCYRGVTLFDTSGIGAGATIDTATVSLYGQNKADNLGLTANLSLNVYSVAPASNVALVGGDYDSFGTTAFCDTAISYSAYSTAGYNDWSLNASGLAAVDPDGVSKFGYRSPYYDVSANAPAWASDTYSFMDAYAAEQTGTSQDPKLAGTYTPAAGGGSRIIIISKRAALWMAVLGIIGANPDVTRRDIVRFWRRDHEE